MTRQCNSWGDRHAGPWVPCEFCEGVAVFHWTTTYPDLLLCRDCLYNYPEAQGTRLTDCYSLVEEIQDSE